MQPLDRVLRAFAGQIHAVSVCVIQDGWRLTFPAFDALTIHFVLTGSGSVRIGDGAWRRVLEAGLAGVGDPGPRLILEISEASAMLLPEVVMRFMAEMQPRGVSFALDDFGAGLVAFRHLKDFLFDCVKVDRMWVAGLDAHPDNQVLCEALITVAHQFEMFAVAEGVETEGEAEAQRAAGAAMSAAADELKLRKAQACMHACMRRLLCMKRARADVRSRVCVLHCSGRASGSSWRRRRCGSSATAIACATSASARRWRAHDRCPR